MAAALYLIRLIVRGFTLTGFAIVLSAAPPNPEIIAPDRAIQLAAAAAPNGAKGIFEMTVQSVGRANGIIYLNSELDYRDQQNLSIEVAPIAINDFYAKFGHDPDKLLKNQRIRVSGEAQRVTIYFESNGQRTGRSYFQTHIRVTEVQQIEPLSLDRIPPKLKEIDGAKASLAEFQRALPGKPALAAYQHRLQKRIDNALYEELRTQHFAKIGGPSSGHGLRLMITVMADGRLGSDEEELKLRSKQEPHLAAVALLAFVRINESPEPFTPELRKEVGSHFIYPLHFTIE